MKYLSNQQLKIPSPKEERVSLNFVFLFCPLCKNEHSLFFPRELQLYKGQPVLLFYVFCVCIDEQSCFFQFINSVVPCMDLINHIFLENEIRSVLNRFHLLPFISKS